MTVGTIPEPESGTAKVELAALLVIVTLAVREPAARGEKFTLIVQLPPAARLLELLQVPPTMLKSEASTPVMLNPVKANVIEAVLVFVIVRVCGTAVNPT